MQINEIKILFDYAYWADERLLQAVAGIDEDQLNAQMPNGIGSIRVTLVHMLSGKWIWRLRWQGEKPTAMMRSDDFPTLETIRTRWQEEKAQMYVLLATLRDEDMERAISYSSTMAPGKVLTVSLWQGMVHLINHLTQHRSEIAMRLTDLGHSPGEFGMSYFLNQKLLE